MRRFLTAALSLAVLVPVAACGGLARSSLAAADSTRLPATIASARVAARVDSGLRIRVVYGPTCPVQRAGQSCVRPYKASLRILREPGARFVTTARSAADGRVTVRLTPGRYLLIPQQGHPFPHGRPETATVYARRFTTVTVSYDSGIR